MPDLRQTLRLNSQNPQDAERAAKILRQNGTVAFPTETVYGLGANALSAEAIERIFVAKQRPHWDPLIVHIASRKQLPQITGKLQPAAEALMEAFWPGPLTLLLPKLEAVPSIVTAGRSLVGVRIPAHSVARALLTEAAIPIAAPSANRFGHISPTTAAHVLADLDGRIDAVLDGGAADVGLESTVAEVRPYEVILYREGAVTVARMEEVLGSAWRVHVHRPDARSCSPESLPSPGVGIRHYAPNARLFLVEATSIPVEAALTEVIATQIAKAEVVGVLLPEGWAASCATHVFAWGPWDRPEVLAQRLYSGLRQLDDQGCSVIIAPMPGMAGISRAIRDRLQKAARPE